jgi:dienelactone hydrolase
MYIRANNTYYSIAFKLLVWSLLLLISPYLAAQEKKAEDFGFRNLRTVVNGDTVDLLVKSSKGDEFKKKPVFFFCQRSLPQPLIKYDEAGLYGVFPFKTDSLEKDFHLVIVSKPGIPLVANTKTLQPNMSYFDPQTGQAPNVYSDRNYLDYYVNRNIELIDFLEKQSFVDIRKLVVAGHSEGSTIAAKMALLSKKITHLIYACGNPMGRIMTMISKSRQYENPADTLSRTENEFMYWQEVVRNSASLDNTYGDTPKATYDFSIPPIQYLQQLTIPVLVCYGTRDYSALFNDYLRVEMMRSGKTNFSFNAYVGLEHNFFELTHDGQVNYERPNWDLVARDWLNWLRL